jgi:hypothetical protein
MMMMLSCTLMGPGLSARSTAWSPISANRGRGRGSAPDSGQIGDGDGGASPPPGPGKSRGDPSWGLGRGLSDAGDGDGDRVHGVRALTCWPARGLESFCHFSEYGEEEEEEEPGGVFEVTPKLDSGGTTPTKPQPVPARYVRACSKSPPKRLKIKRLKSPSGDIPGTATAAVAGRLW